MQIRSLYSSLALFLLLVVVCASSFDYERIYVPVPEPYDEEWDGVDICTMELYPGEGEYSPPPDHLRSSLFPGPDGGSKMVVAYPSVGGIVIMQHPSALHLDHIGLPRTHDTLRTEQDEDTMAVKLIEIGGQWWPYWYLYAEHRNEMGYSLYGDDVPPKTYIAYPSTGGLWLARYNYGSDWMRRERGDKGVNSTLPFEPDGLHAAMAYTINMDERALVLKKYGATFYPSVEECPYLPTTVEGIRAMYEPYVEALENRTTPYSYLRPDWKDQAAEEKEEADGQQEKRRGVWGFMRNLF